MQYRPANQGSSASVNSRWLMYSTKQSSLKSKKSSRVKSVSIVCSTRGVVGVPNFANLSENSLRTVWGRRGRDTLCIKAETQRPFIWQDSVIRNFLFCPKTLWTAWKKKRESGLSIFLLLKGPKHEKFAARPVWIGELETTPKTLKNLLLGPYFFILIADSA